MILLATDVNDDDGGGTQRLRELRRWLKRWGQLPMKGEAEMEGLRPLEMEGENPLMGVGPTKRCECII